MQNFSACCRVTNYRPVICRLLTVSLEEKKRDMGVTCEQDCLVENGRRTPIDFSRMPDSG
jgi:hypothetical protein